MPVWLVLGVQSRARFIVVNGCEVDLFKVAHCDDVVVATGCWDVCGAEPVACCCHRKAPITTTISSMGMPILNHRRVLEFIGFLQRDLFDSLPTAANSM